MFSSFDVGAKPSEKTPERSYQGFVLGQMVELMDRYVITSNRESGFGRCDVMLEPRTIPGTGGDYANGMQNGAITNSGIRNGAITNSGIRNNAITNSGIGDDAVIIEFKVQYGDEEAELSDTVEAALKQIRERNYEASLVARGIPKERIRKYGFAFCGKKVLIGQEAG